MLAVPDADRALARLVRRLPSESVPLAAAAGRVLRADVRADRDLPPADRVTMDGIALRAADVTGGQRRFAVASAQHAGEPPHDCPPGACVEVTTGSVLPLGADAVVPVERIRLDGGAADLLDADVVAGRFVHRRGADAQAGAVLVAAGTRIGPAHVAALATVGADRVAVGVRPRVALVVTGDELLAPGEAPAPHRIRPSNGPAIAAALAAYAPGAPAHARDTPEALHAVLSDALAAADVVVVTGGVSMGRLDLVPDALAGLGVAVAFHRVAQRPGKPLWVGAVPGGPVVFALPGNPVSSLTCAVRYVAPFLAAMEGATPRPPQRVTLAHVPPAPPGLTLFAPVRFAGGLAEPVATGGSGDLVSLLPTDGVAEIAPGTTGGPVPFFPWSRA